MTEEIFQQHRTVYDPYQQELVKTRYLPLKDWEEHLFRKEIKEASSVENLQKDLSDFVEKETNEDEELYQLIKECNAEKKWFEKEIDINKRIFYSQLEHDCDLIDGMRIIIDHEEPELSNSFRFNLLTSAITCSLRMEYIMLPVVIHLLIAKLHNRKIEYQDHQMILPLLSSIESCDGGFPLYLSQFSTVSFGFVGRNDSMFTDETQIKLYYQKKFLNISYRREQMNKEDHLMYYAWDSSQQFVSMNGSGTNYRQQITPSLIAKMIVMVFIPKEITDTELYLPQPTVQQVSLQVDDLEPIIYEPEQLLVFEELGARITVMPLTPDISNWDHFKEYLYGEHNTSGVSFQNILPDHDLFLDFELDQNISQFNLHLYTVGITPRIVY